MTVLKPFMFSKRTSFAVGAFCAFLLVQTAGIALAGDNIVPVSAPTGKWAVGPIAVAAGNQGSGYCSMKTSYRNGQTMVFARDQKGVNSLAIDFKKSKLDVGRQYGVVLAVPPYVMRQMTAVAATGHVLIMQMGRDIAFYDAIRRHDQMVVMLPATGERFAYGLSGTSEALKNLDDCIRQMNPHYQGDPDVMTISELHALPPLAPSDIEPAAGNPGLQIEVETPEASADDGMIELEALKRRLDTEIARLKMELTQSRDMDATVKSRIANLESENDALKKQLQSKLQPQQVIVSNDCSLPEMKQTESLPSLASSPDPLRDLILSARVASAAEIEQEPGYSAAGFTGYAWQSDYVYGGAQRIKWNDGQDFSKMVDGYLTTASERCPGDFAASKGSVDAVGGKQFQTAEIVCMGNEAQSAAALLFLGDGQVLTVISHEGDPAQIDTVLSKRDAVSGKLRSGTSG